VLYRRGLFVDVFRAEEDDAPRTREGPEDPSQARKEPQALEGPRENAPRRRRQDQTKIALPLDLRSSPYRAPSFHASRSEVSEACAFPWCGATIRSMKTVPVIQGHPPRLQQDPIRIRAHTLLCLQGFRGEGYSPSFVENLAAIHQQLSDDPCRWIEIIDAPDAVCAACPNLSASGCSLHGDGSERAMQSQDHDVLGHLGLRVGVRLPWAEVLDCIRTTLTGESLTTICGSCRWLSLGYCREGIDRLRKDEKGREVR